MRTQRHSAVQTKVELIFSLYKLYFKSVSSGVFLLLFTSNFSLHQEQYELVHRAIAQLFEKQLQLYEIHAAQKMADGVSILSPLALAKWLFTRSWPYSCVRWSWQRLLLSDLGFTNVLNFYWYDRDVVTQ